MSNVVGLDLSLTGTGIAIDAGTATIKTSSTIGTIAGRNARITRILSRILEVAPYRSTVVIEGPSFGPAEKSGQAHLRAGLWWRTVDQLLAGECSIYEVAPTALKQFATGSGVASKADMRMALFKRAGIDQADDNQVDAWWLWQMGLHLIGDAKLLPMPAKNCAALLKVGRP